MIRDPEGIERDALAKIDHLRVARLLEIGCGDGRLTRQLAELADHVTAIEVDTALVMTAESLARAAFAAASAIELPFAAKHFDTALLTWSL